MSLYLQFTENRNITITFDVVPKLSINIVTCQAHPVLAKIRRIRCAIRSFKTFCLGGYINKRLLS